MVIVSPERNEIVVFTRELGGGMGHMVPYIPLVQSLQAMGHEVIFILRDLSRVEGLLCRSGVTCLQAPTKTFPISYPIRTPCTYAHILHNMGWSDPEALTGMVKAWRGLYDLLNPSLVIFDHSPTALLAARGYGFKKLLMGIPFSIPSDVYPLPNLRFWLKPDSEKLRQGEHRILEIANRVLARVAERTLLSHAETRRTQSDFAPLKRIAELFAREPQVLLTYKELDPYEGRENGVYWGTWTSRVGADTLSPEGNQKRIFAYLKPFPTLPALLSLLNKLQTPTLAYIPGLDRKMKEKFASSTLRFVERPLNMQKVAQECDLAILNGTHSTTAQLLLAGKPTLQLPFYLEQILAAHKMEQMGAALSAPTLKPDEMEKLNLMLTRDIYAEKARTFSSHYKDQEPVYKGKTLYQFVEDVIDGDAGHWS